MNNHQQLWWAKMVQRYGSAEAVTAEMRRRQLDSRKNPKSKEGGFRYLQKHNPEALKKLSTEAANKRHENKQTTPEEN